VLLDPPMPSIPVEVLPDVTRLTAPNPSVMTGPGTNSYLVGREDLVAIDPGPDDEDHVDAILCAAAERGRLRAVVVTHTHEDHAPSAGRLGELAGVPVFGFGARDGFEPTAELRDGSLVEEGDLTLEALHTPGHASNHLCYLARTGPEVVLFSGDHVMGGSTVVIAPPDGDMDAYLASLRRLLALEPAVSVIAPGHGPLLPDPSGVVEDYIAHRLAREAAVLESLTRRQEAVVEEIVRDVYTDVPADRHPIAAYSVWAHLLKLLADGRAWSGDPSDLGAVWRAKEPAPVT
jgi:glyoxylase-like metal-dependent hydrolase (beta-lactamase superfamily II)